MRSTRFAVAIAVVCVACVKVSDDVKATFAPAQPSEVDNFSPRSPHSIAPPDPILTQAVLTVDASTNDASRSTIGMCSRDDNATAITDAGSVLSSQASNCMQDAGNL
jgi:hypothetical protein